MVGKNSGKILVFLILAAVLFAILIAGCVSPPDRGQISPAPTVFVPAPPYYDIPMGYEYRPMLWVSQLYDPDVDKAYIQIEAPVLGSVEPYYNNNSGLYEDSFQILNNEKAAFVTVPSTKVNGTLNKGVTVRIFGYYSKDVWFEGTNMYGTTIRQPWIFAHNVTIIAPAPTPKSTAVILRTIFDIQPDTNYTPTSARAIYTGTMDSKNIEIIGKVFSVRPTIIIKDGDGIEVRLKDFQVWGNALSYGDPLFIETLPEKINGTVRDGIMVRIKGFVSDKWEAGEPMIYAQYVEVIPEET